MFGGNRKEKPRVAVGTRPGVGVTAEGGRRKLDFLMHVVHAQQTNLP